MRSITFAARFAAFTSAIAVAGSAHAAVIYLDFENIAAYPNASDVLINGYYNGGTASNGNAGPNVGVEFTSPATLLCLNTATANCSNTSRGDQGIPTSARGALYYPGSSPTMNVAAGFDTGFAGVFSAPFTAGTTVSIFSDLNGTGSLLASLTLGTTAQGDTACDQGTAQGADYCPFQEFSLAFAGTAKSVVFGGTVNQQVFDDFTFGSTTAGGAVPEPTTWAMMIGGFGAIGGTMRMRRRKTTVSFA